MRRDTYEEMRRNHQQDQSTQREGKEDDVQGMMQGMMQAQILDVKKTRDLEVVRSSVAELPRLVPWKAESAPLDLTDWFLAIEPAMGDLSDNSQFWWTGMLQSARRWYSDHQDFCHPWRR